MDNKILDLIEALADTAKGADIMIAKAVEKIDQRVAALEKQAEVDDIDAAYTKAVEETVATLTEEIDELTEERDEWRDAFHKQAAYSVEVETKNGWLNAANGDLDEQLGALRRRLAEAESVMVDLAMERDQLSAEYERIYQGLKGLETTYAWHAANRTSAIASQIYGDAELALRCLRRGE